MKKYTYLCQHGNCMNTGPASEMILISGKGYKQHFCSWLHAALGCLYLIRTYDRHNASGQLVTQAEDLLNDASTKEG